MRILNMIHAQSIGGVDQIFRNYNKTINQSQHNLAIVISSNGNESYDEKQIFKLKNISPIFDILHLIFIFLKFKPNVIFCHSSRLMKWMRFLKFFTSAKIVAINHGIRFKPSLNCQYIININEQIHDMVIENEFKKNRSFVIENAIDVNEKYLVKTTKSPKVIGMYGRIEHRKGFDILIKAMKILIDQGNKDLRLKIGGFEVDKAYNLELIKKLAKECNIDNNIDFVGVVLDKKEFFKDVDIFCVPSREEPFGIVILESFLFSTLVISSNTDGGKLLIKNNVDGILFENQDYKDLANKISYAINNWEACNSMTRVAFDKLVENFSLKSLSKKIENLLEILKII